MTTIMPSVRSVALVAAALVSAPAIALAQSAAAPSAPPAAPAAKAPAADRAAEARVEARIKQLHRELRITAAEEPQWKAFAQVMRENARDIDAQAAKRVAALPRMTAVESLQSYEQLAEAHVQRLKKLVPAFEALYNAMPPQQKELADEVFRTRPRRRARMHGR